MSTTLRAIVPLEHPPGHGRRRTDKVHRGGHRRRWPALMASVVLLATASMFTGVGIASAEVDISTDYPVVNVQAGQSVVLDLNLAADGIERVALDVAKTPAGWTADLEGGGFTIGGVYVSPDKAPAVQLHVQVPGDAATGSYHVVVDAASTSGTRHLDVQFNVVTQASNAYTLTSQFDKLQGSTTDTFNFSLDLANNTGKKATFGLTAQGPQGWTVTASPSSKEQASAVEVDSGSTATISVKATPPKNVEAGTYPIVVAAQGAGTTLQAKLSVEVVGSAELTMTTANQVLNAAGSAGRTTDVHLTLTNTGTAPLQGISLASTPPSDWKVTFDPSAIDTIAAGQSQDVVAHITPSGDAITGDYQVALKAESQSATDSIALRYTVQTSTWWGLVGVAIIAIVIVGLLWLFRRFGRR